MRLDETISCNTIWVSELAFVVLAMVVTAKSNQDRILFCFAKFICKLCNVSKTSHQLEQILTSLRISGTQVVEAQRACGREAKVKKSQCNDITYPIRTHNSNTVTHNTYTPFPQTSRR